MSDQQPGAAATQRKGSAAPKVAPDAKGNGARPTVTARRPISKDEYARTTKAAPDATAVIPAVREDSPEPAKSSPPEAKQAPEAEKSPDAAKGVEAKAAPVAEPKKAGLKPEVKKAPAPTPTPAAAPAAAATTTAPAAPSTVSGPAKPAADPAPTAVQAAVAADPAPSRSARLKLLRVNPWSVTKMAFVVSVALMIVSVVAVTVFWIVLQITGVWGALNDSVSNVLADDASAFDVTDYLGFERAVGITLLVSSLNVIFMTALATIAAHLYNLSATILGGVELTFGERRD